MIGGGDSRRHLASALLGAGYGIEISFVMVPPVEKNVTRDPCRTAMEFCLFAALLIVIASAPSFSYQVHRVTPADPHASDAAKEVLNYLASLPNKNSKRVVSGQLIFYAGSADFPDWWTDIIRQTGYAPGLMHADNRCTSGCSIGAISPEVSQQLIDHWNAGGLVMISAHHSNPLTGGDSKDKNFSAAAFTHLLKPGDPINLAYLAELDLIARQLRTFQDSGVVVLYRPLLEMNGDWYWWAMGTSTEYVQLWRMEFDYLTQKKALHNLLFVWAPNSGFGRYRDYYPGDAYVDVSALDFYQRIDGMPVPKMDGYDQLTNQVARSKPFGLAEYGPLDPGQPSFSPQDYYQLIVGIKRNMPRTTFWSSHWTLWSMGLANPPTGRHLNVAKLFADPWVVHEGEFNFSDSSRASKSSTAGPSTQH